MYLYKVKINCVKTGGDSFMEEFITLAVDEQEAIKKTKEKARKQGYLLKNIWDERSPEVERIGNANTTDR